MKNKRGQGMSTQTIILLILGLIILVVLIAGFSTGWSGFKKVLAPTNVDSVVEDCALACSLDNGYSFCSGARALRSNEDKLSIETSCFILSKAPEFSKYNIAECLSIDCSKYISSCSDLMIDGKKGQELTSGNYNLTSLVDSPCYIN